MSDVERLRAAGRAVCSPRLTFNVYPLKVCVNTRVAMACRVRAGADRGPLPAGPIKDNL